MKFWMWFSGGERQYMQLYHCMNMDSFWVGVTVTLDLAVAAGYVLIARHWWVNERSLPNSPAKGALRTMRNIFVFCGICGYLFIPIKMFWPAWRLYDFFMAGLVYFTWKYASSANNLKVVYNELGRSTQLQADLDRSREESRRKSAFLNALSHDLRTPLNGVLLQAQVAKLGINGGDAAVHREALAEIETGARAAAELLERLLQCARLDWSAEPNQISSFALSDVLRNVCAAPRAAASVKGIQFITDSCDGIVVHTDRHKIERILNNLIDNAVKFTERGSIRVSTECTREHLEIHVTDTGVGVAPDQQPRLFDEFFQINNPERDRNNGFGLGLPIARRLATQLGGDIGVVSSVRGGSRFSLSLPGVLERAIEANGSEPSPAPQPVAVETAAV